MKLDELATALKVAEDALKFVRATLDDAALELNQLRGLYEEAKRFSAYGDSNSLTTMDSSIHRNGRDELNVQGVCSN